MSRNSISQLNRYAQCNNLDIEYTYIVNPIIHDVYQKEFICVINYNDTYITGKPGYTKKEAKHNACLQAIDNINNSQNTIKTELMNITNTKYVHILVDYENISNKKDNDILDQLNSTDLCTVTRFASYGSTVKNADIIVNSMHKDSVDHYITMYIGKLLGEQPNYLENTTIYVLTRDSFGACLHDFDNRIIHTPSVQYLLDIIT
jgi:hypothetical protein